MSANELESLLSEFYYGPTTNNPKRIEELDRILTGFKQQVGAWKHCEDLLLNNQSKDVIWFCLSVYEEAIRKHWHLLAEEEIQHFKTLTLTLIRERHSSYSNLVIDKLIELTIEIAKRTWPDGFPDLLPNITGYIFDRSVRRIGLSLLFEMVDSFSTARSDIPATRIAELKSHLYQHVSPILHIIRQVLDTSYDPPSHNRSQSQTSPNLITDLFNLSSNLPNYSNSAVPFPSPISADTSIIGTNPGSPLFKSTFAPRGILDEESRDSCEIALKIVLALFSWIPLSENIDVGLIDTILKFSQLNDAANIQLGVLGLTCMSELMSRKFNPPQFLEYVMLTFKHIVETLRYLANSSDCDLLDDLDEDYRSKFTEFMAIFSENHLMRIESFPNVPINIFFDLLFKYTTSQPNVHAWKECLTIWNVIVDSTDRQLATTKFRLGLITFTKNLIFKIQYSNNASELGDVEDCLQNSFGQTDFDIFLEDCLDTIMKLVDLFPEDIVTDVFNIFNTKTTQIFAILSQKRNDNRPMSETAQIHYIFKDLVIFSRIIGRFSEFFCKFFDDSKTSVAQVLQKMLELTKACFVGYEQYNDFGDYLKMFVETLSIFYPYMGWLEILKSKDVALFNDICANLVSTCIMVIRTNAPESLTAIASKILLCSCSVVKSKTFIEYPGCAEFLTNIHELTSQVPIETKRNLYHMASLACLNCFETLDGRVLTEYEAFIGGLTIPYLKLAQTPNILSGATIDDPNFCKKIRHVLSSMSAIMDSVENEKSNAKLILFDSMKETLSFTVELFKHFKTNNDMMNSVMDYMMTLFKAVRKQLGAESTGYILTTFIQVYNEQTITQILHSNDKKGADILGKFELLLQILVEDNSKMFDSFLPNIISYLLNVLTPLTFSIETEASEIVIDYYFSLLQGIIVQNWKYFFPRSAIVSATNGGQLTNATDPERIEQFTDLFATLFSISKRVNPEHFRQMIEIMSQFGDKCKLFQNELFLHKIYHPFIAQLLNVVIDKSHETSKEEVFQLCFKMAQVDFERFYVRFLQAFILEKKLTDQVKQNLIGTLANHQDSPSFIDQLNRLVADISYYETRV